MGSKGKWAEGKAEDKDRRDELLEWFKGLRRKRHEIIKDEGKRLEDERKT